MCFCLLLLLNLIILVFLGFGSALLSFCCRTLGLVAKFGSLIISPSPAGILWLLHVFITSAELVLLSMIALFFILNLCVFSFFLFWTLWWRSIRAAFNAAYLVIVVKIFILHATCITWWISFGQSYRSLIIDVSSGYLMPLDSSFRYFGGSSVFGGSLYVFILSF